MALTSATAGAGRAERGAPRFELQPDWEKLPARFAHRDVTGVAVDSTDRVYLFTRFDSRILVYERDGTFIKTWGEGIFTGAHGLTIGPDDRVYCVDNGDHTVRAFTLDGVHIVWQALLVTRVGGMTGDAERHHQHAVECVLHPGGPFNRCTNLAVAPSGELYVADGYGNCRIHRFTADGELLHSWGEPGSGPGKFHLPHGVRVASDGRVLVADRENDRIQVFDPDGRYIEQWTDVQRPCDLAIDRNGLIYVAELWRPRGKKSFVHGVAEEDQPGRVSMLDPRGRPLARWGASSSARHAPGNFIAPHSIALDSRGDVYVAEVTYSFGIRPGWVAPEHGAHQIQKFLRSEDA